MSMIRRLPPFRAGLLLPAGILAMRYCSSKTHGASGPRVKSEGDGRTTSAPDDGSYQNIGTRLASQIEGWLLPEDETESVGAAIRKLRDAVAEDTKLTDDEKTRFPVNILMLKALHDRERLDTMAATEKAEQEAETGDDNLDDTDQEAIRKAAHFARYSAAAYGVMGNLGKMKELVGQEGAMPPADVLRDRTYLQKWFVSKHTSTAVDDVKDVVTNGSMETRAYFVAVDHSTKSVVLSIRGTFSLSDTMIDLICTPTDFAGGKAHEGISKSAMNVWVSVKEEVEDLLKKNNDYKLVLTGHSLGAGCAILLKIFFDDGQLGEVESGEDPSKASLKPLDVGRPVHVECYAFAPPPVFKKDNAEEMADTYSFVNGCDCIPTVSLGSMYSLFRTIRHVDQLPLNVYSRARFILDAMVRSDNADVGLNVNDKEEHRDHVASRILDLSEIPTPTFGDDDEEGDEKDDAERENNSEALCAWTEGFAKLGGNIARYTRDVGEAAERLYSGIGHVAGGVTQMSAQEITLTALLVRRLAAGGGPAPDEMMEMVRECEEKGLQAEKNEAGQEVAIGDLIVPGRVYHLHGDVATGNDDDGERGQEEGNEKEEDDNEGDGLGVRNGAVRRASSEELSGIRLSSTMVADHSMDAYEPVMIAVGHKYAEKRK